MSSKRSCFFFLGLFLRVVSMLASGQEQDSRVYVAVMSDRGQFAGLVATVSSIIESSREIQRLRIVIIVPYPEANAVYNAFTCLASSGHSRSDAYQFRGGIHKLVNTNTSTEKKTRKKQRGFIASSAWRQLSPRGGAFAVVGFVAFRHRHEVVSSRDNQRLTSPFNYARLYLGSIPSRLVPVSVEKLIYLDADVTVKADLVELSDSIHFKKNELIAAVPRHQRQICKTLLKCRRPGVSEALLAHNVTDPETNLTDFNAGVLVLHLKQWRNSTTDPLPEMEYWIRMNRDLNFFSLGTNPPLVLTLRSDHQRALAPEWNCQDYDPSKKKKNHTCIPNAKILHYSGAQKPWFLPANESFLLFNWSLPHNKHICADKLNRLGIRARRQKRAPFDFRAPGIPDSILKKHIAAGDIPGLRPQHKHLPSSTRHHRTQDQSRPSRRPGFVVGRGRHPNALQLPSSSGPHTKAAARPRRTMNNQLLSQAGANGPVTHQEQKHQQSRIFKTNDFVTEAGSDNHNSSFLLS